MGSLLRVFAVVLLLSGTPLFLMFWAVVIGVATVGPPDHQEAVPRFLLLYAALALSGLLSAAGGLLWVAVRIGYPRKGRHLVGIGSAPDPVPAGFRQP